MKDSLTVIIPVKNELDGLKKILNRDMVAKFFEIIVVDDGSVDGSADYARSQGVKVISNSESKGNGAAIKAGILAAKTEFIGMMDGDGQHSFECIIEIYENLVKYDLDLCIGVRSKSDQAGFYRYIANKFYNKFSSWMVGKNVLDLTSGQRVFKRNKILNIVWLLPDTFSYPTTSTMIFYRLAYSVGYQKISVSKRIGKSHIKLFRDGFRFFLIIMKIGTLYSPFKLFVPISFFLFSMGLFRYVYTYLVDSTFTNMSAMLFTSSIIVFLMGVISEQISLNMFLSVLKDQDKAK